VDEATEPKQKLTQIEDALREAVEAAREAQASRTHLLSALSHELRTPLNTILGFTELLLEDARRDGSPTARRLEKIHEAGGALLGLVNDLLDLSRAEGAEPELHLEDTDPELLAREALALQRAPAEEYGIRLVIVVAQALGLVRTDAVKLRRALLHVLSNAVRFTHHGTVTLAVERDLGTLTFTVTDTGVGMTEAELQSLARPFPHGDLSPSRTQAGAGLGLALADRLCALLGGTLALQSAPGRGTVATLRVPTTPPRTSSSARVLAPEVGPRGTAVVVDDDPCAREILAALLAREGFGVRAAATAPEALEFLRAARPALLTLDLLLPDAQGWNLLAALQGDPALQGTPVLVVSVLELSPQRRPPGVTAHLLKPVDPARLAEFLSGLAPLGAPSG
jgi:CheY-like chemotaxis protein/nitrogen-specific signal transduction histidine kinase